MSGRSLLGAALALTLGAGAAVAAADPDTLPDPSPTPKAAPGVARAGQVDFRTDTLTLPLSRGGAEGSELDYLVRMRAGDALVYSWVVEGGAASDEFYSDFHGTTPETPPAQVLSYREGTGVEAKGSLTAPFDGVHGWLFKNDSPRPVTLRLTIAGFYELRSLRETMGLDGGDYLPFGPPGWADRYGPVQNTPANR